MNECTGKFQDHLSGLAGFDRLLGKGQSKAPQSPGV